MNTGRATWAEACLTPPVTPNTSDYKPSFPGFDQYTMDRAHLLAAEFGGIAGRKNRVVTWRSVNQGDSEDPLQMRQIESQIENALAAGKRVYYYAQAIYGAGGNPYMPAVISITWA